VYDGTHLNAKGAAVIGPIVAEALAKAVPDLAAHIKIDALRAHSSDLEPSSPDRTH
jgi:hypothetical protein